MYVVPVSGSSHAVPPVTIGTLVIGAYEESYGYTSAVLYVIASTVKLAPKQHVSAFESLSLNPSVPGGLDDGLILSVEADDIRVPVLIAPIDGGAFQELLRPLRLRNSCCSRRPPIIVKWVGGAGGAVDAGAGGRLG